MLIVLLGRQFQLCDTQVLQSFGVSRILTEDDLIVLDGLSVAVVGHLSDGICLSIALRCCDAHAQIYGSRAASGRIDSGKESIADINGIVGKIVDGFLAECRIGRVMSYVVEVEARFFQQCRVLGA